MSTESLRDVRIERALVGACVLTPETVPLVRAHVAPEDFFDPAMGTIFSAVEALVSRGSLCDVGEIATELRARARLNTVGGAQSFDEITDDTLFALREGVTCATHAETWARRVGQLARLRRARQTLLAAAQDIVHERPDDALAAALRRLDDLTREAAVTQGSATLADAAAAAWDRAQAVREGNYFVADTGFTWLDGSESQGGMTGGMHGGQLWVMGAEQGGGKTVWAWQVATMAALSTGRRAQVFSLEMGREEIAQRLACGLASRSGPPLDLPRVRRGRLDPTESERWAAALQEVSSWPIDIEDTSGLTIEDIRARAHAHRARNGEQSLVVIDHLLRLSVSPAVSRGDLATRVEHVTRSAKNLARELGCPVLLLNQLTRAGNRAEAPSMHDFYGGSAVEGEADVILTFSADEDSGPKTWRPGRLHLLKNRGGPTGDEAFLFQRDRGLFVPLVDETTDRLPPARDYRVERDEDYPPPSYGDAE